MAYDGPNKAASEAKDRIMAKTKAKREGMKEATHSKDIQGYADAYSDVQEIVIYDFNLFMSLCDSIDLAIYRAHNIRMLTNTYRLIEIDLNVL